TPEAASLRRYPGHTLKEAKHAANDDRRATRRGSSVQLVDRHQRLMAAVPLVTTEQRGTVGIVSFNEPEALNPLSTYPGGSEEQLADGIVAFDRDPEVKVIVLTGAGRAFSSGADARPARSAASAAADKPADVAVLRALSASPYVDEGRAWS